LSKVDAVRHEDVHLGVSIVLADAEDEGFPLRVGVNHHGAVGLDGVPDVVDLGVVGRGREAAPKTGVHSPKARDGYPSASDNFAEHPDDDHGYDCRKDNHKIRDVHQYSSLLVWTDCW